MLPHARRLVSSPPGMDFAEVARLGVMTIVHTLILILVSIGRSRVCIPVLIAADSHLARRGQ